MLCRIEVNWPIAKENPMTPKSIRKMANFISTPELAYISP